MTPLSPSLALAIALACAPACAEDRSVEIAAVAVEDGDTLVLTIDARDERFQLAHVDAPEDADNAKLQNDLERTGLEREVLVELGRAATAHLRGLSPEDTGPFLVVYDPTRRDRYGRLVGEVRDAAGRSLGGAMVRDGFARVLPARGSDSPPPAALIASEADAISAGRGLWGDHRDTALEWRGQGPR